MPEVSEHSWMMVWLQFLEKTTLDFLRFIFCPETLQKELKMFMMFSQSCTVAWENRADHQQRISERSWVQRWKF